MIRHAVRLDESLCRGCTNCLKHCPTEAIRVKDGKARIIEERCVDCGECVRRCPFRAKKAVSDSLDCIEGYDIAVALPSPALFGQFPPGTSPGAVVAGLHRLGFDEVFEVAYAAEAVSRSTARFLTREGPRKPVISSSCPAVTRLIRNRYPEYLDNLIPLRSPMEIAARSAKDRYGRKGKKIGAFFISPCAAKVTVVRDPLGTAVSAVDGVIGISEIWRSLQSAVTEGKQDARGIEKRKTVSFTGIAWARSEGEADGAGVGKTMAADGVDAVMAVLEALEDGRLKEIDFLELMACPSGCIGGPLTVENPSLARSRIRALEAAGETGGEIAADPADVPDPGVTDDWHSDPLLAGVDIGWDARPEPLQVFSLDEDFVKARSLMAEMDALTERLPDLDCGACGAPSCRALAEDIVRNHARETDCVFRLRDLYEEITGEGQYALTPRPSPDESGVPGN